MRRRGGGVRLVALTVGLVAALVLMGFGAVVELPAASGATALPASAAPAAPIDLVGTQANETAIWWSWGMGGTENNTLYLYNGSGCRGVDVAYNVLPYTWVVRTPGLTIGYLTFGYYSAEVTDWLNGIQSGRSACADAHIALFWHASPTGSSTASVGSDPNVRSADSSARLDSISATNGLGQFEVWTAPSPTLAVGWAWSNGTWANVTASSNESLIAPLLYASAPMACMAWDPMLGAYMALLTWSSAPDESFYTYLLRGGSWVNDSAVVGPFGHYSATKTGPCKMAFGAFGPANNPYMVVLAPSWQGNAPTPLYAYTFPYYPSPGVVDQEWINQSYAVNPPPVPVGSLSGTGFGWDAADSFLVFTEVYNGTKNSAGVYAVGTWLFSSYFAPSFYNDSAAGQVESTWGGGQLPNDNQPYPVSDGGLLGASWGNGYLVLGGGNASSTACGADTGAPYAYFFFNMTWWNVTASGNFPWAQSGCEYEDWGMMGGAVSPGSMLSFGGGYSLSSATSIVGNAATYYVNETGAQGSPTGYEPPAAPLDLSVSSPSGGDCSVSTLSWSNPAPPSGLNLSGDVLYIYDSAGAAVGSYSSGAPADSMQTPSLALGGDYYAGVQAVASNSASSPLSGVLQFVSGCLGGSLSIFGSSSVTILLALSLLVAAAVTVAYLRAHRRGRGGRHIGGGR